MSDAYRYFMTHAVSATFKARSLPRGRIRDKQRAVARIYHLLAKGAAPSSQVQRLDDFRNARNAGPVS